MSLRNILFLFSTLFNTMNVFTIGIVNKDIKRVNICVILGFVFNAWFFLFWIIFSCYFACLVIFKLNVSFIMLDVGFLCTYVYSFKSSWALFWSIVKLLRNSLIISSLALKQPVVRAPFLPYWSNSLPSIQPNVLFIIWGFSSWTLGTQTISSSEFLCHFFLVVLSLLFGISQQQVLCWSVLT